MLKLQVINIIGCGPTASSWDGKGDSLGCNDCEKYGNPVQNLLVLDWPGKFKPERLRTISDTKAVFWTQVHEWNKYKELTTIFDLGARWRGYLVPGKINKSSTSPFVAVMLAWHWGYKEIILWGVDMNDDRPYRQEELSNFKELFKCLKAEGVNCYLGTIGSSLNLPVYDLD